MFPCAQQNPVEDTPPVSGTIIVAVVDQRGFSFHSQIFIRLIFLSDVFPYNENTCLTDYGLEEIKEENPRLQRDGVRI